MTGNELLTAACHLMFEPGTGYYEPFAVTHINALLGDNFDLNNRVRVVNGLVPHSDIPSLASLAEAVPAEPSVLAALPYGLASRLFFDHSDAGRNAVLEQRYDEALEKADRGWVNIVGGVVL